MSRDLHANAGGKQNGGLIPLNKQMYSLSFALAEVRSLALSLDCCEINTRRLAQAGISLTMFSIFYFLSDAMKWWTGVRASPSHHP